MLRDAQLQFDSALALTAAAKSTNTIDAGIARDLGTGKDLFVVVTINTTFTDSGTNAGTQVSLEGSLTGGSAFTTFVDAPLFTIPQAAAAGSGPYYGRVNPGSLNNQAGNVEFIRLSYAPLVANLTGGALSAFITDSIAAYTSYARGYTVS